MADLKPPFQKTRTAETRSPNLERLYGLRFRVTRYLDTAQLGEVAPELFLPYGEPDIGNVEAFPNLEDLCFVGTGQVDAPGTGSTKKWLTLIYETLTDTLVDEVAPVVDYELNGLKRVTHRLIAKPGIDLTPYAFDVGSTLYPIDPDLVLGQLRDESTDAATRIVAVYLEPGVISKREEPGPVPGTKAHTWRTWMLDATSEADMGVGNTIPGVATVKDDDNVQGFLVRLWSSVGGTIVGVKYSYKDVVDVRVPGTVALTTQAVTADDLSGTIAVANVTPPRTKSVAATVTVEITTTPPSTASVAYDLGSISCAITATQAAWNYRGFDMGQTLSGDVTMTYPRRSASIGANNQFFPGCYLVGSTTATGSFSYNAGAQYSLSSGGTVLTETVLTSTETNTLTGTGSTAATDYATTGILQRRSRPVFTDLAGTTYYEVITWSVP